MCHMSKYKKILICIGLIICIGLSITFINKATGTPVENTVRTAIRIQYGWGSMEKLKSLCTDALANSADFEDLRIDYKIYSIDSISYEEGLADEEDAITVFVEVYSPDIRFHVMTLVKDGEDAYRIKSIEVDAQA